MIKSFADKRTEQIYNETFIKGMNTQVLRRALIKLRMLDQTTRLEDLKNPPSNHLEKKEGDLKEFFAIRVNKQYRILFKWIDNNAYDVKFTDYH